jgi:hypothetical protein
LENLSDFSRRFESLLKFINDSNIESVPGFLTLLLLGICSWHNWEFLEHDKAPFQLYKFQPVLVNSENSETTRDPTVGDPVRTVAPNRADGLCTMATAALSHPRSPPLNRLLFTALCNYKRGADPAERSLSRSHFPPPSSSPASSAHRYLAGVVGHALPIPFA